MKLLGQYPGEIVHGHPRANADGGVYKHVLIAEEKLGRYLEPEETVHHIDGNKLNYAPENLLVFATKADHTRFHMSHLSLKDLIEVRPNVYIAPKKENKCKYCNKEISRGAEYCKDCYNKYINLKVKDKPTKEELYNLLIKEKGNFTKIGKFYSVTDNAVRKWCKKYNLPSHSKDYKTLCLT